MERKIVRQWTTESGHPAAVVFNSRGRYHCGYVGVGVLHPFFDVDYNAKDPDGSWSKDSPLARVHVHGGLTYSGDKPAGIDIPGTWWFGYDCAHLGDLVRYDIPGLDTYNLYDVFRDEHFCVRECESLSLQLSQVEDRYLHQESIKDIVEAAEARAEKLKAKGWTKQDFANALGEMLSSERGESEASDEG